MAHEARLVASSVFWGMEGREGLTEQNAGSKASAVSTACLPCGAPSSKVRCCAMVMSGLVDAVSSNACGVDVAQRTVAEKQ